jgi:ribosomal protein S18 acetylase RimI-like enzyme
MGGRVMIIRKATSSDTPGIAKVQVDSWRSTYKGIIPNDFLDSLSYDKQEAKWNELIKNRKTITFVAENPLKQIIGFATGGPERTGKYSYESELYAIYILKEYQRKGIGKQLIQGLIKEGMSSFLVWVLADNPSRRFYEKLGGKKIGTESITIGGVDLDEVAYGLDSKETLTLN